MGTFTIDLSGLGQAVSNALSSLAPLFYITAGLVVAGAALSWGIDMLRSWQDDRAERGALSDDVQAGFIDDDGQITAAGVEHYQREFGYTDD